ncbi:MAG TPA: hypothetical protein VK636_08260 [Gemmatimonadaceae bacterium]|nr:hypothetical protein [Gemmatimonadaceae bacterium]
MRSTALGNMPKLYGKTGEKGSTPFVVYRLRRHADVTLTLAPP